jgi:hypothetical protein
MSGSRAHVRHSRRAGNETRCESGDWKTVTGSSEPDSNVAECADRHNKNDDDPDCAGIERRKRPHLLVWQKRQNDQGSCGEDQGISDFIFTEHAAHEAVERGFCVEKARNHDCDGGGKPGAIDCEPAKQNGGHERDIRGETRIASFSTPISERRQGENSSCGHRQ